MMQSAVLQLGRIARSGQGAFRLEYPEGLEPLGSPSSSSNSQRSSTGE